MRKVLFATLCFFNVFNFCVVNASECDSEDIERLKVLASSITYNSEFIGNKDMGVSNQSYNVNFVGITDEVYISDVYGSFRVNSDNDVIIVNSGIRNVEVYSKYCDDKRLKTITIDLPKFNTYSLDSYCDNVSREELYVCDPWYQGEITFDSFLREIDNYELKVKQSNKSSIDKGYDFFVKYYYIIIPIVVIIISVIILLVVRKIKKNRLY